MISATSPSHCPAVLFIVFNRPDTTALVFEKIRAARPQRFYVAADGARRHRSGEQAVADEVRGIATRVDWPCELATLFRAENLGCKRAVSQAIDWFFEHEEEGIILEDDCLPHPDFFSYCAELLQRYRNDERIGLISGTALADLRREHLSWDREDYVFSRYFSIWGWATWRRAWADYDVTINAWSERRDDILALTSNRRLRSIQRKLFDNVAAGKIDTWDYQVAISTWLNNRLAISPRFNLIENIGFRADATHTVRRGGEVEERSKMGHDSLAFPLTPPTAVCPNHLFQAQMEKIATRSSLYKIVRRLLPQRLVSSSAISRSQNRFDTQT